jgi:hypothetical protein
MRQQVFHRYKTSRECWSKSAQRNRSAPNEHRLIPSASLLHGAYCGFESTTRASTAAGSRTRTTGRRTSAVGSRASATSPSSAISASRASDHHTYGHAPSGPHD